jgi:hypothetical protein
MTAEALKNQITIMNSFRLYTWHTTLGVAYFVIFVAAAVALDKIVGWMENQEMSHVVTNCVRLLENGLFAIDSLLFLLFILRAFLKTLRELWKS